MSTREYQVIVIGGGHAGVEAAWAAANLLPVSGGVGWPGSPSRASVALVTLDPSKIGVMSCNPAIGGLAKGQIVREIDALGGLMGLATDATGIQFKVLNTSKGPAVHGPRAQCDKHAYAAQVQAMIASCPEIEVIAGSVEEIVVEGGRVRGVKIKAQSSKAQSSNCKEASSGFAGLSSAALSFLPSPTVILTTGTFMRGLMHTGEAKTSGGRFGESAAEGISGALRSLGFELGRLKTGTPPRLSRASIEWEALPDAPGDERARAFSDLSGASIDTNAKRSLARSAPSIGCFPVLPQVVCKSTSTTGEIHELIRANIHRAPMYSGQIESTGPRYCPSIEDKVVRFGERDAHNVFLEPESLIPPFDDWIYCNGISTSLPADVQDAIVRGMPGCSKAAILRYGYAVEYDMVRPHQIFATGMTKLIDGLFLAGQINGTSGYEEAAGQGIIAGINAARLALGQEPITIGRDQGYIGVLMDDLVTKTPVEPYRMFTSRAEHRLLLRSDNAADRLTPLAISLSLLAHTDLGRLRQELFEARTARMADLNARINRTRVGSLPLADVLRRPEFSRADLAGALGLPDDPDDTALFTVHTDRFYSTYIERQQAEVRRAAELERRTIPAHVEYSAFSGLRAEARESLDRFRPATLGQAARLEGLTPADVTLLAVLLRKNYPRHLPEPAAPAPV